MQRALEERGEAVAALESQLAMLERDQETLAAALKQAERQLQSQQTKVGWIQSVGWYCVARASAVNSFIATNEHKAQAAAPLAVL